VRGGHPSQQEQEREQEREWASWWSGREGGRHSHQRGVVGAEERQWRACGEEGVAERGEGAGPAERPQRRMGPGRGC
jgi:hypothetical protein